MNHSVEAAARPAAAKLPLGLALSVFLPFAAGYFLSYFYRSVNAVIAPDLVADAGLAAADLGLLTSVYFLTFAALQLPLGIALDRFGPRRVVSLLLLVAAAGAAVFALARGLPGLTLGRALIGAGVSACLMSSFKAFAQWFPARRLPTLNGMLLAVGGLGAISATAPVEWLLGVSGWRALFLGLAAATAGAALLIFAVVPEHSEAPAHTSLRAQLAGLAGVFRDRFFWRVAPLGAVSAGASQAVLGLWLGPWLRDVGGFERGAVAGHLFIAACAMAAGFLLIGVLAERLARIGVKPVWVLGTGTSGFMLLMIALASGVIGPVWLLLIPFAFLAPSGTLNYALVSQHFGSQLAGRANTALNLLVFVASFLMQWGVGIVLGGWEDAGAQQYGFAGYRTAFGGLALLQALSLVWFFGPGARRARAA